MTRSARIISGLIATAAFVVALAPHPAQSAAKDLKAARTAIEKGRYEEAVKLLKSCAPLKPSSAEDAECHYLIGLARFRLVDKELAERREKGAQKKDVLEPSQVDRLKEILQHLLRAVEMAPQSDFAPEASFLSAWIQDHGYLQRWQEARKGYSAVVEKYPGTDAARKAEERVIYHNNLFKHAPIRTEGPSPDDVPTTPHGPLPAMH